MKKKRVPGKAEQKEMLQRIIRSDYRFQYRAAKEWDIAPEYLSRILNTTADIPEPIKNKVLKIKTVTTTHDEWI